VDLPLPLIFALVLAFLLVTGLYVRERSRKTPKTMRQVSADQKDARDQRKAEARRTITLIKNEIASNRRRLQSAVGVGELTRTTEDENWVAHRHTLAELPDSERRCTRLSQRHMTRCVASIGLTYWASKHPSKTRSSRVRSRKQKQLKDSSVTSCSSSKALGHDSYSEKALGEDT